MESTKKAMLLGAWQDKLTNEQLVAVSKLLDGVSETKIEALQLIPLKNPLLTFLLSLFLGGIAVDRFYIGDVGLGILKLLFGWMTFGVWYLLDWYFAQRKAKDINFNTIVKMLS
ncbi:MAG: TM2 domain-containing protein [Alphaproteobacteria bacterium]|jgi:TM2 domain-containing membrane protein YozV|nr:TM2 domain-containing protein [Alphaproteobacteria bacterium]